MKEIKCQQCGEPIENGFNINPTISDICEECEKLSGCCGAEILNGFCSDCKEHA